MAKDNREAEVRIRKAAKEAVENRQEH